MSLCTTRRRPSTHTAKPAVIRPVPSTFGLGILPPLTEAERTAALNAALDARKVHLDAAVPKVSEALEARRSRDTANLRGIESARRFGYRLGRSGCEDASSDSIPNHHERIAFIEGHTEGLDEYHRMEVAMYELRFAEMEREGWGRDDFGYDDGGPWGDGAEYGSCVGHCEA